MGGLEGRRGLTVRALSLFEHVSSVVCVGAHPDDIEIGCGGTVLALQAANPAVSIRWLVLTSTKPRRQEAMDSAHAYLGDHALVDVQEYRDGYLPYADPVFTKEAVVAAAEAARPDLVFAPRLEDAHQDHRFVAELAWQVFRNQVILHYEIAKYEGDLGGANVYVPLTEEQAHTKVDRLFAAFPSQHDKPWFERETFLGLMRLRGMEAGGETVYAEAFSAPKLVVE